MFIQFLRKLNTNNSIWNLLKTLKGIKEVKAESG